MEVKIEKIQDKIPCIQFTPLKSKGGAVIVHGYGGSKEEQLGMALRVAIEGITTCAIDLRGHGENQNAFDLDVLQDLETALDYCRQFGKVVAIGHSIGGRLAIISSADYKIGISPALGKDFSPETQEKLRDLRYYRVKQPTFQTLFKLTASIPPNLEKKNSLLIYASRDVPEIKARCEKLKSQGFPTIQIKGALHNDIYTLEETFNTVTKKLKEWLN